MKNDQKKIDVLNNFQVPLSPGAREVFRVLLVGLVEKLSASTGSIMLINSEDNKLVIVEAVNLSMDSILNIKFNPGEGIAGLAFETKTAVIVNDTTEDERFLHFDFQRETVISALAYPLKKNDEVIGVINFTSTKKNKFKKKDINLIDRYSILITDSSEDIFISDKNKQAGFIDDVTGLYGYTFFMENISRECQRSKRYGVIFSVVFVKITNFGDIIRKWEDKQINKSFKLLGKHIHETSRGVDICALYANDIISFILPETGKWGAKKRLSRLIESVNEKKYLEPAKGELLPEFEIKVGISTFPQDGETVENILNNCFEKI